VSHLLLADPEFLLHGRPPDKVQAVGSEQEGCARVASLNLARGVNL
jgi:hypothetical protein